MARCVFAVWVCCSHTRAVSLRACARQFHHRLQLGREKTALVRLLTEPNVLQLKQGSACDHDPAIEP